MARVSYSLNNYSSIFDRLYFSINALRPFKPNLRCSSVLSLNFTIASLICSTSLYSTMMPEPISLTTSEAIFVINGTQPRRAYLVE
jgi:hypothetical protein